MRFLQKRRFALALRLHVREEHLSLEAVVDYRLCGERRQGSAGIRLRQISPKNACPRESDFCALRERQSSLSPSVFRFRWSK